MHFLNHAFLEYILTLNEKKNQLVGEKRRPVGAKGSSGLGGANSRKILLVLMGLVSLAWFGGVLLLDTFAVQGIFDPKNRVVLWSIILWGVFLSLLTLMGYALVKGDLDGQLKLLGLAMKRIARTGEIPKELPLNLVPLVQTWGIAVDQLREAYEEKELVTRVLAEAASFSMVGAFCRKVAPVVASYGGFEAVRFFYRRLDGLGWNEVYTYPEVGEEDGSKPAYGGGTFLFFLQGQVWGGMEVAPFPEEVERWSRIAHFVAVAMASVVSMERVRQASVTDELTGFYSRRHLFVSIQREISRAERYDQTFSIVMLEVDNYREVNELFGLRMGDRLLVEVGRIIKGCIRKADKPFRFGMGEFVILLPGTHLPQAEKVVGRIVEGVGNVVFQADRREMGVQVKVGVASYRSGDTPSVLLKRVDRALYKAKKEGVSHYTIDKGEG